MTTYSVSTVQGPCGNLYQVGYPWVDQYLSDLATTRSANTVRSYAFDLARWLNYCRDSAIDPLKAKPRDLLGFVEAEKVRPHPHSTRDAPGNAARKGISNRTISRRLAAIRQWYHYLMLDPEETGVSRNPVPAGSAMRAALGARAKQPALVRYDRPLPRVLSAEEIDRFLEHLTVTRYRDKAIVYLMLHGGLRISEALGLRLGDIGWGNGMITVHSSKSHTTRRIPIGDEAEKALSNYVRLERPKDLDHDFVFVCLGRKHFGQPMTYKAWSFVCEKARQVAGLPGIHAHAFRHTCATNLAEGGMPLDSLQKQLGHAHIETTMLYNNVRNTRLAREHRLAIGGNNVIDN